MDMRRHKAILYGIAAEKHTGYMTKLNKRGERIMVRWSFARRKPRPGG